MALFALFAFCLCLVSADVPLYKAIVESDRVENEYIVVFSKTAKKADLFEYLATLASQDVPTRTFEIGDFRGCFVTLTDEQLAFHLQQTHILEWVEENQVVTIGQCTSQTTDDWALLRLSERLLDLGNHDSYYHGPSSGEGVTSYIIDTGVYIQHSDFGGRATWGANFVDTNNVDCNGHGTHVASSVAGTIFGVAKKTTIVGVKVLNCAGSGTFAGVIAGIEWVTNNHNGPSTANMSLGGGFSAAVNAATAASVNAGVFHAVAAGNNNGNACNFSPASTPEACTVGATTIAGSGDGELQQDIRATFSNWGTCVDVFAPGQLVRGAWIGSPTETRTISGTSMASPHVCGVASVWLGENPTWTPTQVEAALLSDATANIINLSCGSNAGCNASPNLNLYSNCH